MPYQSVRKAHTCNQAVQHDMQHSIRSRRSAPTPAIVSVEALHQAEAEQERMQTLMQQLCVKRISLDWLKQATSSMY
jgi:hypothetical protein